MRRFTLMMLVLAVVCMPGGVAAQRRPTRPTTRPSTRPLPDVRRDAPPPSEEALSDRRFVFSDDDRPLAKDASTPLLVHLIERYLSGASDRNELDKKAQEILSRHPGNRALLQEFVADFRALSPSTLSERFTLPDVEAGAPLTGSQVRTALSRALPGTGSSSAERPQPPRVTRILPEPPPEGYRPGQQLSIQGSGFARAPSGNRIEIRGRDDLLGASPRFTVTGSQLTRTGLAFRLPDRVAPGIYGLTLVTDGGAASQIGEVHVAVLASDLAPTPILEGLDVDSVEAGGEVTIVGHDFVGGSQYHIGFYAYDWFIEEYEPWKSPWVLKYQTKTRKAANTRQIPLQVPPDLVPGRYQIAIWLIDSEMSNRKELEIEPSGFRLELMKLRCDALARCGDCNVYEFAERDTIQLMWLLCVDDRCFLGRSERREYSRSGQSISLLPEEGQLWPVPNTSSIDEDALECREYFHHGGVKGYISLTVWVCRSPSKVYSDAEFAFLGNLLELDLYTMNSAYVEGEECRINIGENNKDIISRDLWLPTVWSWLDSGDMCVARDIGSRTEVWLIEDLLKVFPQPPASVGDPDIPDSDFSYVDNGDYWHWEVFGVPWSIEGWEDCPRLASHVADKCDELFESYVMSESDYTNGKVMWLMGDYELFFKVARQPLGWNP
jgi:hypothetical protein